MNVSKAVSSIPTLVGKVFPNIGASGTAISSQALQRAKLVDAVAGAIRDSTASSVRGALATLPRGESSGNPYVIGGSKLVYRPNTILPNILPGSLSWSAIGSEVVPTGNNAQKAVDPSSAMGSIPYAHQFVNPPSKKGSTHLSRGMSKKKRMFPRSYRGFGSYHSDLVKTRWSKPTFKYNPNIHRRWTRVHRLQVPGMKGRRLYSPNDAFMERQSRLKEKAELTRAAREYANDELRRESAYHRSVRYQTYRNRFRK